MAKQKLFECLEHGTFEASNVLDTKRNLAKCPHCGTICTIAMPAVLDIEFTNRCMATCYMCPRAMPNFDREVGDMPDELFDRIANEIRTWNEKYHGIIKWVWAHLGGSSLLHPHAVKFINALAEAGPIQGNKRKGPDVAISSNAIPINEDLARSLLASRLHRLILSVDGITAETYEKIRGMNFDTMQKNVDKLLQIARERQEWGLNNPQIWIQILRLADNEHEWLPFVRKYSGNPRIRSIEKYHPIEGLKKGRVFVKAVERFGGQYEGAREQPGWDGADNRRATCTKPWDRLSVFWDGTCSICCYDIRGLINIGTLKRNEDGKANSIHGIWHGTIMKQLRSEMMTYQKSEGKKGSLPELCRKC